MRALNELLAQKKTAKILNTFVYGGISLTESSGQRYEWVNDMRVMRRKIAELTKVKGKGKKPPSDEKGLVVDGVDYDALLIEAAEVTNIVHRFRMLV